MPLEGIEDGISCHTLEHTLRITTLLQALN